MKFKPTKAHIAAAETVFLAKAHLALIQPVVTNYQREILVRNQWKAAPQFRDNSVPEVITDPALAYLLPDDIFPIYDAQCKAARVAAGLYVENPDHCPMLVAEGHVREAERALVDEIGPVVGITADQLIRSSMVNYKKFVDLSLRMLAPLVNSGDIMERVSAPAARAGGMAHQRPSM